ncbi:DUF1189 domain-containing protein [Bacillus sp. T33-2]|uniref:DUF1189 domain-containing protein n=1 Tax=Bacillus sp. T33-2 TaxID=2054168 RepID=UPI000C760B0C|nr:DUF1189 domain-containing protein [Bacillus sp. T33-2]PLR89475.1 DUF1189 domain-containing protein [Bacillus sp. T33-2]
MNIFKQFYKSLYSPKDISMFRFQGIGKTILYVFFITLISIIPTGYYFSQAINSALDAALATIDDEIPAFTIENGVLQSGQKEPVTIEQDDFTIYFDSTGMMEAQDLQNNENAVALLKDELVFIAGGQVTPYPYSIADDMTVSKQDVASFLESVDTALVIIIPILLTVIYLFSSAAKFIEVSMLALFGLILKNIFGKRLKYPQLWRMSAYSVTLPTVFFTVMASLKTTVPYDYLLNWFVALSMLTLAMKEIPSPKQSE